MTFEREERIAFARVVSDLIEADFIVKEKEIETFDKIRSEKDFNITISMLSEAKKKTFAEAVSTLQGMKDENKKQLIKDKLGEIALSDGSCAPSEALQIMAVNHALDNKGQVLSMPASNSILENMKVLYIENENGAKEDEYIRSNYRAICNEFKMTGFDFVYIPQIADDYKHICGKYLNKVIKYMMPSIADSKVEKIQHDLCSMTTAQFCHKLLFRQIGINTFYSGPSFLFKISESSVADRNGMDDMERVIFSNYLLLPLNLQDNTDGNKMDRTILDNVSQLTDNYRSMVSNNIIIENQPSSNNFFYHGFHRSLFDLVAYAKERENYKIVINLNNRSNPVVLRPVDAKPDNVLECDKDLVVDLTPQPYTLYILMICMSFSGTNLDWTDYTSKSEERSAILKQYNAIYYRLSKGNSSMDYRDKSHVSRIKRALNAHKNIVANIDMFVPAKISANNKTYYTVPTSSDFVYVIEGPQGMEKEVKMTDSEYWKSHFGTNEGNSSTPISHSANR